MKISIEGRVRRRTRIGKGIFRIERWNEEPFKVEFEGDEITNGTVREAAPDLVFRCELPSDRIFVRAEVKRKPFILGEIEPASPKVFTFSILSVAAIQITGILKSTKQA